MVLINNVPSHHWPIKSDITWYQHRAMLLVFQSVRLCPCKLYRTLRDDATVWILYTIDHYVMFCHSVLSLGTSSAGSCCTVFIQETTADKYNSSSYVGVGCSATFDKLKVIVPTWNCLLKKVMCNFFTIELIYDSSLKLCDSHARSSSFSNCNLEGELKHKRAVIKCPYLYWWSISKLYQNCSWFLPSPLP